MAFTNGLDGTGSFITDSGGFQVFSLSEGKLENELKSRNNAVEGIIAKKVSEEGVIFKSHRDGTKIELTPESTVVARVENWG